MKLIALLLSLFTLPASAAVITVPFGGTGASTAASARTNLGAQAVLPVATNAVNGYLSSTDWTTFNAKQNTLPVATTSVNGYLSSTDWTTFNAKVPTSTSISTTGPLSGGGDLSANRTLSITQSATAANGYLSSTDWNTFNGKASTAVTISTTSPLSGGGNLSANRTFSILQAATAVNGYLSSTDWNTFNTKVDRSGDTMSGALVLPSNGLTVGTSQLAVASGRVGIGTASPAVQLSIDGGSADVTSGQAVIALKNSSPNYGPQISLSNDNSNSLGRNWKLISGQSSDAVPGGFMVYDSSVGQFRLVLDTTGRAGIGTITPTAKLEVNGGVRLNTATVRPTCDIDQRGTQWVAQGAGGATDVLSVCLKSAADTYNWIQIVTGG